MGGLMRQEDIELRLEKALKHIEIFIQKAAKLINSISVKDLIEEGGLNPYLIAALGIRDIEGLAEIFVYRRVERSLGTSFGNVIEEFLRILLGGIRGRDADRRCRRSRQRPWICWWDIVIPDKKVVISVKSGPADVNKDIIERFIQHAREAERNNYKPYLALTYGKRAFAVVESTFTSWNLDYRHYVLVGRDIFRVLLGTDIYDIVIDRINTITEGIDIFTLIENKIDEISNELKKMYGNDITRLLKDLS